MSRGALALLLPPLVLLAASADAGPIASLRDGAVIVPLPPDWRRIDQEELDLVSMWAAEATGGRVGEVWEAGFAPGGRDLQLGPPFVLAQMDESGRVSYGEVSRLPDVAAIQSRIDGIGSDAGDRLQLAALRFDRDRFALETVSRLPRSPWGELDIRTLTYLTESGSLTLHGYLRSESDPGSRRAVDAILEGVRIADGLAYRPRPADHWLDVSRRPAFWYLLAGATAATTVVLVWWSRRRLRG